MAQIFKGVKILDLTKVFSGPFATRMFADYGAEVIKVENKDAPDDARFFPPLVKNWSGYFEILNRNKKAIALNLKEPDQLAKLYQLVSSCDVFVENLSPKTKFSLKIDYQTLVKINPRIIYASLSGLGKNSERKYYDIIAQAESGMMSLTGAPDMPTKIGPAVVDAFSGMTLAFSISAALFYREKTGKGQSIEVSMRGAAMNLLESNLIGYSVTKKDPLRTGNIDNLISPFGVYNAGGTKIALAIGSDTLWEKFIAFSTDLGIVISPENFGNNGDRLKHSAELTSIIERVFLKTKAETIIKKLTELGIPCAQVQNMSDVASDSENFDREFLKKVKIKGNEYIVPGQSIVFSENPEIKYKNAPIIGEDNDKYGVSF